MNKITAIFSDCIPLFAVFFVVSTRPAPTDLEQFIAVYLLWFLATLLWSFICNFINSFLPKIGDVSYFSALKIIALIGLILAEGIIIVLLHQRTTIFVSQSILILLLLLAISYRLLQKEPGNLDFKKIVLLITAYQVGASYLSFQLIYFIPDWQSVVYALGFGLITCLFRVKENFFSPMLLVAMGAGLFSILPFSRNLPNSYLMVLGLIPLQNLLFTKKIRPNYLPAIVFIVMLSILAFI